MSNADQALLLRALADVIQEFTEKGYGQKMGFILLVGPFHANGIADYISNGKREDCIKWMRETIDRFEKNEMVPEPTITTKQ